MMSYSLNIHDSCKTKWQLHGALMLVVKFINKYGSQVSSLV